MGQIIVRSAVAKQKGVHGIVVFAQIKLPFLQCQLSQRGTNSHRVARHGESHFAALDVSACHFNQPFRFA